MDTFCWFVFFSQMQKYKLKCKQSQIFNGNAENFAEYCCLISYAKHPNAYENIDAYIDEDPWQQYKGFGEDKYVVSYLEGIDSELKNIIAVLM